MAHLHVLPARAGMSPPGSYEDPRGSSAPRTGGDEPGKNVIFYTDDTCSPHGRG